MHPRRFYTSQSHFNKLYSVLLQCIAFELVGEEGCLPVVVEWAGMGGMNIQFEYIYSFLG